MEPLPNSIDNSLLNDFFITLDPLVYFHDFSSKIIPISPAILYLLMIYFTFKIVHLVILVFAYLPTTVVPHL